MFLAPVTSLSSFLCKLWKEFAQHPCRWVLIIESIAFCIVFYAFHLVSRKKSQRHFRRGKFLCRAEWTITMLGCACVFWSRLSAPGPQNADIQIHLSLTKIVHFATKVRYLTKIEKWTLYSKSQHSLLSNISLYRTQKQSLFFFSSFPKSGFSIRAEQTDPLLVYLILKS